MNKNNKIFAIAMTLFTILAIAGMVIYSNNHKSADDGSLSKDAKSNVNQQKSNKVATKEDFAKIDLKNQPLLGSKDAKVKMIEFGDYKCPACKYFELTIKPDLQKYIDKGDLSISFINYPLHGAESGAGSLAAENVWNDHQKQFWDFHKNLFKAQPDTKTSTTDYWLGEEVVLKAAKDAKISNPKNIVKDVKDAKYIDNVKSDVDLVQKLNLNATPTIIINNEKFDDALNKDKLIKKIEEELK